MQGNFERLKAVNEVTQSDGGEIILFIDEIHTHSRWRRQGKAPMDAANILKPALARESLRSIGAPFSMNIQKYFEKDKATKDISRKS